MVDVLVPLLTTLLGGALGWWFTRSAYLRQREDSARDAIDRQKHQREIIRAGSVPELLETLQVSIDFVTRLAQAMPDNDALTGYRDEWLEGHAGIKRTLDPAVATHPIHTVLESIGTKWSRYVEAYDRALVITWDDPVLETFPMLVEKDTLAVSRALVLAGEVKEALQAARRRAADSQAIVAATAE